MSDPSGDLPACGLYRTARSVGGVPAGRLVYFHNHGNPGPGVYFPEKWAHNRAQFSAKGVTLPQPYEAGALVPLPAEGFYRVRAPFHCCEKQCVRFEPEALVQLGYDGAARALLFVPELVDGALAVPERGTVVDEAALANLVALTVPVRATEARGDLAVPRGLIVH